MTSTPLRAMAPHLQLRDRRLRVFLPQTLLKASLLLGLISAGYFEFVSPDADKSQDLLAPTFVRRTIVLWVCYQRLAADMSQPESSRASSPHA